MSDIIIKNKEFTESYYYSKNKIFKKEFINNKCISETIAAENAGKNFSLAFSDSNILLYQQLTGDICMAENNNPHRIILKHSGSNPPHIIINYIKENNPMLIYNIVESDATNRLVNQFKINYEWSKPQIIDIFQPDFMRIVRLGADKYIMIYSKKMPEIQFGYREIDRHYIKNFKMVYATGLNVKDFSYVITKEALHFVFLQTKGFMCRIIYVRRDNMGLSRPVTVCERNNIKKCLIGIVKNKVIIWWINNNTLYYTVSYDFGTTFNRIEADRNVNGANIKKMIFRDNTPSDENKYIFNEVFIEGEKILGTE